MSDFELAVKSTIDKAGNDIATALGVAAVVDIDDAVNISEVLTSPDDVILVRFLSIDEDPIDPLYSLTFMIGAKTTSDSGNYDLMGFVSAVKATFKKGGSMLIMDWSGAAAPTEVLGDIYFTESGVDPQVMDRQSGMRMLTVEGKAVRKF